MNRRLGFLVTLSSALVLQACGGSDESVGPPSTTAGTGAYADAGADNPARPSGGAGGEGGTGPAASAGQNSGQDSAGAATGGTPASCGADAVAGLAVFSPSWDALGYPPYAIDGCTLVYVGTAPSAGALRRRNLATGEDVLLDSAATHPRRPSVAGGVIAWERDGNGGSEVSVLVDAPARTRHFEHAGEPRATSDAVVFTRFSSALPNADTDVMLYEVETDAQSSVGNGAGQQRFADVSLTHVAFTDFAEDPKGYFDEVSSIADVVIVERKSGERTLRSAPGKQAFPLLGSDGLLVYLEWGAVHPEPKFSEFTLKAGNLAAPVASDFNVKGEGTVSTNPAYVRPSLHGVHLDYIDDAFQMPKLYRSTLDSAAPLAPTVAALAGVTTLLGPASADALTLVAKQLPGQTFTLVAVAR
jgi:hypothetical protein